MQEKLTDQELERLQKKAKGRVILWGICTAIVFVLVLIVFGMYMYHDTEYAIYERIFAAIVGPIVVAGGFAGLFYPLFVKRSYENFNLSFKNKYVLPTLQSAQLFENLEYQPFGGLSYDEIRDGAVVNCGQREYFHSEDLLTGKYQDIRFSYSDIETKRMVRRGKKRELQTIFEGQVMIFSSFDSTKTSFGHLQIFEKEFLSNIEGWTAQNKVKSEDEVFNKRFTVYAADPHNAFYILTPRMLEQITRLADRVGKQIAITFTGPIMYVAIHRTRSMFNGYVDKSIATQQQDILDDADLLRQAGDLLILEMASMSL
ncbi:MAG: DUF3137 domain-containing protein [Lachnospiraceae bacterium]|nr:DUF3137 domain-containing protein [Lachnospiraceae bacterium]